MAYDIKIKEEDFFLICKFLISQGKSESLKKSQKCFLLIRLKFATVDVREN